MPKKRSPRQAKPATSGSPRRRLKWTLLLWLAPIAFVAWRAWPELRALSAAAPADRMDAAVDPPPAPPFRVATLDGREISDDALRGKVVLLNFWATWCPPCRAEMPGFQQVYQRHARGGNDFVVLGVSMDQGSAAGVARYVAANGITYPVAMATGWLVQNYGGAEYLPTSFLIDRQGRIRREVHGMYDAGALEQDVQRLLGEPATVALGATEMTGTAGAAGQ